MNSYVDMNAYSDTFEYEYPCEICEGPIVLPRPAEPRDVLICSHCESQLRRSA